MSDRNPLEWALLPLKRYAQFSGRAPRAEYWWYVVVIGVLSFLLRRAEALLTGPIYGDFGPISLPVTAALLLPSLAVTVRRLHDSDRTGWWAIGRGWGIAMFAAGLSGEELVALIKTLPMPVTIALGIIYFACVLTLFVFMLLRGSGGANRFGPDPYGRDPLEQIFT